MSKPTLYRFALSVWCAAADAALIELKLADEIDVQQTSLMEAENMTPAFLKKVPNSTLPSVTDGDKVYGSTVDVVEYMKNKSSVKIASRTKITELVHEAAVDPNFQLVATRNDEEIKAKAGGIPGLFISNRLKKMKEFVSTPEAGPFKELYDAKITGHALVIDVYSGTASAEAKEHYLGASRALHDAVKVMLYETLPGAIPEGPFVAGAAPGEDDFHVLAWLARTALCAGATTVDDTPAAFEKTFGLPPSEKIVKLLQAWAPRESFKYTYPEGKLH